MGKWLLIGGICVAILYLAMGYIDFPHHGRVLDMHTKQPIEGAVVVAIWIKKKPAAHPIEIYYEAKETMTDSKGEFTIPGIWGGFFSNTPLSKIREPLFTIFKPGYAAYGSGSITPEAVPEYMRLYKKGGRTVVELKPLKTREERLENLRKVYIPFCTPDSPGQFCFPKEKLRNIMRLKDLEQSQLAKKWKRRRAQSPSLKVLEALPPPSLP